MSNCLSVYCAVSYITSLYYQFIQFLPNRSIFFHGSYYRNEIIFNCNIFGTGIDHFKFKFFLVELPQRDGENTLSVEKETQGAVCAKVSTEFIEYRTYITNSPLLVV